MLRVLLLAFFYFCLSSILILGISKILRTYFCASYFPLVVQFSRISSLPPFGDSLVIIALPFPFVNTFFSFFSGFFRFFEAEKGERRGNYRKRREDVCFGNRFIPDVGDLPCFIYYGSAHGQATDR